MERPNIGFGMRHVALSIYNFEACVEFYVKLLGMTVEWRPNPNSIYLTSGNDNLALHRASVVNEHNDLNQRLDHIGFFLRSQKEVNQWFKFLDKQGVKIKRKPRIHRDGAYSFYCYDPDNTSIQFIHYSSIKD